MILKRQAQAMGRAAFTLMEMLVVVAILVVLAGAAVPVYLNYLDNAKLNTAKIGCKTLEQAVQAYKAEYGQFPQTLQVLTQRDQQTGTFAVLDQRSLFDPWNQPYVYEPQNLSLTGTPHIYSNGPPGAPPKQISNWDK